MKLHCTFRKGLFLLTASLFLFLSLLGQNPLQAASLESAPGYSQMIAQAETAYSTNISPGKQFAQNPTFDSTLKQRETGLKIGTVVRKSDATAQAVPGPRMKDIGKYGKSSSQQENTAETESE